MYMYMYVLYIIHVHNCIVYAKFPEDTFVHVPPLLLAEYQSPASESNVYEYMSILYRRPTDAKQCVQVPSLVMLDSPVLLRFPEPSSLFPRFHLRQ